MSETRLFYSDLTVLELFEFCMFIPFRGLSYLLPSLCFYEKTTYINDTFIIILKSIKRGIERNSFKSWHIKKKMSFLFFFFFHSHLHDKDIRYFFSFNTREATVKRNTNSRIFFSPFFNFSQVHESRKRNWSIRTRNERFHKFADVIGTSEREKRAAPRKQFVHP